MKHAGMILGVIISTLGLSAVAANKPMPAKSPISIAANLNPQAATTPKSKPEEATPAAPSVLEPGSRVVASNAPDEDFVILGHLEKALPEAAPKSAPNEALGELNSPVQAMVDATTPITPPVVLKAPVEVKSGIQTAPAPKVAVVVAGPNIGAAPLVKKPKAATPVAAKAVSVALNHPHKETSALAPPPKVTAYLEKPSKPVKFTHSVKAVAAKPMVAAVVHPVIKPHTVIKQALKKAPVKLTVATAKPRAKAPMIKPVVVKSVAVKKTKLKKPVLVAKKKHEPVSLAFASYHPPKHKTKIMPLVKSSVASVKTPKANFKPVIKPFKSASVHAARKSHFHPVIKPYITS